MLKKIFYSILFVLSSVVFADDTTVEKSSPIPSVVKDGWHGSITPYAWLPSISSHTYYHDRDLGTIDSSYGSVLSHLSAGAMLEGELHYDRFGVAANLMYSSESGNTTKVVANGEAAINDSAKARLGVYTLLGTYTAYNSDKLYVDAVAGARILNMNFKNSLNLSSQGQSLYQNTSWYSNTQTNPVVGVKGYARISDSKWFIPFYVDIGGGGNQTKVTSQQILGVGYGDSWWNVKLVWNNLYYSLNQEGGTGYVNMTGPALGVTFAFE